jgi:hypothetical protein
MGAFGTCSSRAPVTYRHPPKVGARKLYSMEHAPPKVGKIAWKAQSRLTARYRRLTVRESERRWFLLPLPAS